MLLVTCRGRTMHHYATVQIWAPAELKRQLMKEFQDNHLDLGALFHLRPISGCCTLTVSVRRLNHPPFTEKFSTTEQ